MLDNDPGVPFHSATAEGGSSLLYGAKNSDMVLDSESGRWTESWLWGRRTVYDVTADYLEHPGISNNYNMTLQYIKIYEKP